MVDVNIEYVRGILFVKLEGNLNVENTKEIKSRLENIIKLGGIRYISFNIVDSVIEERIDLFDKCNILIKKNNGKMFICGLKTKSELIVNSSCDDFKKVKNELAVLKIV